MSSLLTMSSAGGQGQGSHWEEGDSILWNYKKLWRRWVHILWGIRRSQTDIKPLELGHQATGIGNSRISCCPFITTAPPETAPSPPDLTAETLLKGPSWASSSSNHRKAHPLGKNSTNPGNGRSEQGDGSLQTQMGTCSKPCSLCLPFLH